MIWPRLSVAGMLITATDKSKHFDWFTVGGFWRLSWFEFLQELFRPNLVLTGRFALSGTAANASLSRMVTDPS